MNKPNPKAVPLRMSSSIGPSGTTTTGTGVGEDGAESQRPKKEDWGCCWRDGLDGLGESEEGVVVAGVLYPSNPFGNTVLYNLIFFVTKSE